VTAPAVPRPSGTQPVNPRRRPLPFPLNVYQTAVGKKWAMAITGFGLLGFVVLHTIGNLKLYLGVVDGQYDINVYGEFLRDLLVPLLPRTYALWILRLGLIAMFAIHIHAAYALTVMNRRANVNYRSKRDYVAANFASRTMRVSGIIVALYLLFHLADLTWGWTSDAYVRGHVYENMVNSLGRPLVALIYIVGNVALSVHIYHGIWSAFQSMGVANPRYNGLRRGLATGIAAFILVGNLSFPIAIVTGIVDEHPDQLEHSDRSEASATPENSQNSPSQSE
jgi:succinate dehydrogenase / fumarate reductase cytochrome b subunit